MFVMTRASSVDLQKRFPVVQVDSMFQVASVCRSSAKIAYLESLLVDWERVKMFHYSLTLLRGILQSHSNNSSFLVILVFVKWVFVLIHDFLSHLWTENSSTRSSWTLFISLISCIFRICVSRSAFSSSCSPNLFSSRFNISVMGVLQIQSLSTGFLLKITSTIVERFHFLLLHQFSSCLSKQVISISFKKRFCNIRWVSISKNRFIRTQNISKVALFLKIRHVPIFFDVRAMPQVSLYRWSADFEMILTANILFQSDKFVIVPALASRSGRYRGEASRSRICSSSKSASWGVARLSIESWIEDNNDWLWG